MPIPRGLRDQSAAYLDDRVDDRGRLRRRHRDTGRAAARHHTGNIVAAGAVAIGPSLLMRALVVVADRAHAVVAHDDRRWYRSWCVRTHRARERRPASAIDRRLLLFGATLILVVFVVRNPRDEASWSLSTQIKPIPERLRALYYVRRRPLFGYAAMFGFLAMIPLFISTRSQEYLWTEIVLYALVALSITPLAGLAGQLSLGQFAFVGLGSLTMVVLRASISRCRSMGGTCTCTWCGSRPSSARRSSVSSPH